MAARRRDAFAENLLKIAMKQFMDTPSTTLLSIFGVCGSCTA